MESGPDTSLESKCSQLPATQAIEPSIYLRSIVISVVSTLAKALFPLLFSLFFQLLLRRSGLNKVEGNLRDFVVVGVAIAYSILVLASVLPYSIRALTDKDSPVVVSYKLSTCWPSS